MRAPDARPRLCMVVHAYYPLAEPRVQREARAARDAGLEVSVLALRGAGEAAREVVDGIQVHRLPLSHRRGSRTVRMLFEYVAFAALAAIWLTRKSITKPFAVVHVHSPPDFLVIAALTARLRGTRLILDVHDLSSHMFRVRMPRQGRLAEQALLWFERRAAALVDAVVTVHEPYRRELVNHHIPPRKVRVVMNAVDDAVVARAQRAAASDRQPSRFTVAYHGTLTWWYGTDLIVEAIALLRDEGLDIDAVILGDGDALPALQTAVAQRGLREHVFLSGSYLPIEQALGAVARASCGVIPNRPSEINRFALSSKLFEYVGLGIPVVVAELETLAAHFGPEEVTFFHPGDSGSLATAIRWVYENQGEAHAQAERARQRASAYSWAHEREVLIGLYGQLTGSSSLGA